MRLASLLFGLVLISAMIFRGVPWPPADHVDTPAPCPTPVATATAAIAAGPGGGNVKIKTE